MKQTNKFAAGVFASLLCIAVLLLTGCINWSVPKTKITGSISGQPFELCSPKDSKLTGLEITSWNMGAFSNHVSIRVQSVEANMNPDVITTTGDSQVKLIQAVADAALQGAAMAVKP